MPNPQRYRRLFFAWDGEVLVVNILGKPGAGKEAIGKPKGTQLRIRAPKKLLAVFALPAS
ncbi:hypothetical protein RCH06_000321 [Polaromonas sp. CG_9.5]|uniref:hypothetical protein n=1 Tax=Polaromonas sp. CG_9.5 TaxID=3071705 RepID=UPI002DFE4576|nr:hypothetical protein [Polaromonas sp. CG_9.5]